ncbi:hypothetical protein M514_25657 [Trichuris suis]|uniref:Uncharacterized protein n=1 Tax=Trichuris suis TaxID=68888 RepID=A0A085LW09_9BILA|nr:hypothetical protein M513_09943 [Trichuris suis]KFD49155.1 hypothetical protein M513_09979 [Trichuris suis]KFD62172.1 hypothetical protein M514_25657 [Trichuris suis]
MKAYSVGIRNEAFRKREHMESYFFGFIVEYSLYGEKCSPVDRCIPPLCWADTFGTHDHQNSRTDKPNHRLPMKTLASGPMQAQDPRKARLAKGMVA